MILKNNADSKFQTIKFYRLSVVSQVSIVFFLLLMFVLFRLSFSFLKMEKICWWICLYSAGCIQHWWPYHKCKCYRAFNILLPNTPNWTGIPLTLTKEHTNIHMHKKGKYRWTTHRQGNYFYIIMNNTKRWLLVLASLIIDCFTWPTHHSCCLLPVFYFLFLDILEI